MRTNEQNKKNKKGSRKRLLLKCIFMTIAILVIVLFEYNSYKSFVLKGKQYLDMYPKEQYAVLDDVVDNIASEKNINHALMPKDVIYSVEYDNESIIFNIKYPENTNNILDINTSAELTATFSDEYIVLSRTYECPSEDDWYSQVNSQIYYYAYTNIICAGAISILILYILSDILFSFASPNSDEKND